MHKSFWPRRHGQRKYSNDSKISRSGRNLISISGLQLRQRTDLIFHSGGSTLDHSEGRNFSIERSKGNECNLRSYERKFSGFSPVLSSSERKSSGVIEDIIEARSTCSCRHWILFSYSWKSRTCDFSGAVGDNILIDIPSARLKNAWKLKTEKQKSP